jgi:hypothetical protein
MGIFAGNKQSTGVAAANATLGNRIFHEYNNSVYYTVGTTDRGVAGGTDAFVAKYDTNGTLQWQRTIGGSGTETGYGVYADTSANVYIVGTTAISGQNNSDVLIVKYDTNGILQWQRTWGGTGIDIGYGIYANASYVLITGSTTSSGFGAGSAMFLLYYNVSGALQWQRVLYTSYDDVGTGVTLDGAYGRFVICGYTKGSTVDGINTPVLASFDTAGNQAWQNTYYTGNNDIATNVIYQPVDTYLYFTGNYNGNNAQLTKIYGNTGYQWTRLISGGTNMRGIGLSWDRYNYTYFTGPTNSSDNYFVAKYDTNGNLTWQKRLSGLIVNDIWVDYNANGIAGRDQFYISGANFASQSLDATVIKLPQDGTNTGTYSKYAYATSTLNSTAITLTNTGAPLTVGTPTLTSTTSTLTSSTSTLTSSYDTSGTFYTTTLGGSVAGIVTNTVDTNSQYTIHTFKRSGTFVPKSTGFVDVLAIGAGGDCGAPGPSPSGGGGAGSVVYRKFVSVSSGTMYPVGIGTTTINGAGGNTIFNTPGVGIASITAFGGGAGGTGSPGGIAGSSPNASGGGASPAPSTAGVGYGASTFGYPGGTASPTHAGGGGGAGSVGGNSPGSAPGLGGSGVPIAYFTGITTNIVSAGGGPGVTISNYGNGGQSNVPGTSQPGAIYIRYI